MSELLRAAFASMLIEDLASVRDGTAKTNGIDPGKRAADAILAKRA